MRTTVFLLVCVDASSNIKAVAYNSLDDALMKAHEMFEKSIWSSKKVYRESPNYLFKAETMPFEIVTVVEIEPKGTLNPNVHYVEYAGPSIG